MSNNFSYPLKTLSRFAVLVFAVSWCAVPAWSQTPEEIEEREGAFLEYSPNADVVVIEYDRYVGIETNDPEPLLRIYGDGRVHVHIDQYLKRAGDYEMSITHRELSELLVQLHSKGMLTTTTQEVRRRQKEARVARARQARAGEPSLLVRTDKPLKMLKINLTTFKRVGRGEVARKSVTHDLRTLGISDDAKDYASVELFQELNDGHALIQTFLNHSALQKLED